MSTHTDKVPPWPNSTPSPASRELAQTRPLHLWLAYVSYPVTTAVYLERALRRLCRVTTLGPKIGPALVKAWNLENMRLPIKDQDIPSGPSPDIAELARSQSSGDEPQLLLWVESVHGFFPQNLSGLSCPKACYLIDTHIHLEQHLQWAQHFDHVFVAQQEYLPSFRQFGIRNVHWLPLACDPEIHRQTTLAKEHDIGFVGSLNHERRRKLIHQLQQSTGIAYRRCFWDEMADFLSRSRIVFNNAARNDLNMRVFETLSLGSFLLTDAAPKSGLETLFRSGEDCAIYDDADLVEKARYYLDHETERETIAARGRQLVLQAHTYAHRCENLLKVCLGEVTTTPSAEELRALSEIDVSPHSNNPRPSGIHTLSQQTNPPPAAVAPITANDSSDNLRRHVPLVSVSKPIRCFVTPVIDFSPASPYNIKTLLRDLEQIEGDVIVVFNSKTVADQLSCHPRINYSVVMSHNVGVSRAWNIGLNVAESDVTFIANSDLHITQDAVEALQRGLLELPDAAIVGPQGSYFHFEQATDLAYFDKGSLPHPLQVDAVSGFLFAVKTRLFNPGPLNFDNIYTPIYFEEWDTGLQCRLFGLRSYVVPTIAYAHEWSGSIRALRTIRYYNRETTSHQMLERNRQLFWDKWRNIAQEQQRPDLLQSLWVDQLLKTADEQRAKGDIRTAQGILQKVLSAYPGCPEARTRLAA